MSEARTERTCPARDCIIRIDRSTFACARHWRLLSPGLRARVWRAFRSGDIGSTVECYDAADAEVGGAAVKIYRIRWGSIRAETRVPDTAEGHAHAGRWLGLMFDWLAPELGPATGPLTVEVSG